MADLLAAAIYDQPRSEGSGCDCARAGGGTRIPKNPRLVEVAMSDFAPAVIAARWGVAAERKPPETVDQPLAACD